MMTALLQAMDYNFQLWQFRQNASKGLRTMNPDTNEVKPQETPAAPVVEETPTPPPTPTAEVVAMTTGQPLTDDEIAKAGQKIADEKTPRKLIAEDGTDVVGTEITDDTRAPQQAATTAVVPKVKEPRKPIWPKEDRDAFVAKVKQGTLAGAIVVAGFAAAVVMFVFQIIFGAFWVVGRLARAAYNAAMCGWDMDPLGKPSGVRQLRMPKAQAA